MFLVEIVNEGDPWSPTQTESPTEIIGVDVGFDQSDRSAWLIESSDKAVLIDAQHAPRIGMRLRDEGTDYSIINLRRVQPGETEMIYKLQVRV